MKSNRYFKDFVYYWFLQLIGLLYLYCGVVENSQTDPCLIVTHSAFDTTADTNRYRHRTRVCRQLVLLKNNISKFKSSCSSNFQFFVVRLIHFRVDCLILFLTVIIGHPGPIHFAPSPRSFSICFSYSIRASNK